MLKGNKKWKALDWQLRAVIIGLFFTFTTYWPILSMVTAPLEYSMSYYIGAFASCVVVFLPWIVVALYIGYKEWFTDEAA